MPIRSGAMQRPRDCRCGNTLRQRYDEVGLPWSSTMGSPSPTSTYAISLPRTRRRCFWYGNAAEIMFVSMPSFAEGFMGLHPISIDGFYFCRRVIPNADSNPASVDGYVAGPLFDGHWTFSKSGSYQGVSEQCRNARARGASVEQFVRRPLAPLPWALQFGVGPFVVGRAGRYLAPY